MYLYYHMNVLTYRLCSAWHYHVNTGGGNVHLIIYGLLGLHVQIKPYCVTPWIESVESSIPSVQGVQDIHLQSIYCFIFARIQLIIINYKDYKSSNRLSSTIDGNRKIGQLRTTSQVSNVKRKTRCCPTS